MKGVYLILCLMLARDIAGSIFRPQFDPRMANLVVQPLELLSDQQSIEQHQQNRHHHPRHRYDSSDASASRSEDSKERASNDEISRNYHHLNAPVHAWNSALYSTVIRHPDERQTYGDVVSWMGKQINEVPPQSPTTNEKDNKRSSIFYDAFTTMKHMTDEEKKRFHEAYQTAVQTSNEDVHLNAPQLLKKHHYEVEEHKVKTDDGYILTLFRIPAKKDRESEAWTDKEHSKEHSRETTKDKSDEDSKEGRREGSYRQSKENNKGHRRDSKEHTNENSKEYSSEKSKEHSREESKEHSREKSKEHSREESKEHSREKSKEHNGQESKEHSRKKSEEHSGQDSKEHNREKSKEHSGEESKEHSKEHSRDRSNEHSEEKSKERNGGKSGDDSRENRKKRGSDAHKAPVVFLMHGLLGSADDWLLMGPGKSLAYMLADAGYDVWLGNARGNKYSRRHVSKHPAQPDFWQFTTDEIALHDLPAMIDYVLNKTKQHKLVYVGHSQGTTAFFALTSTRPEYNDKIKVMYAISPMVYMENIRSPLLRMIAADYRIHGLDDDLLGKGEFNPNKNLIELAGGNMCEYQIGCKDACSNVHFVMAGINPDGVDASRIPVIMGHLPAGTSIKQVKQYGQATATHEFRKYDYGADINEKMYGHREPPKYDISKVKVPVAIYYSEQDWLSHPKDVDRLRQELPNVNDVYKVPEKHFTHTDFQFSKRAPEVVYKRLIKSIKKEQE